MSTENTTSKRNSSAKVEDNGSVSPNMIEYLGGDKKILVLGPKGEAVPSTLDKLTIPKEMGGAIHISSANYSVQEGKQAFRETTRVIAMSAFLNNPTVQSLKKSTRGGAIAFRLAEDTPTASLQAFNILLACTEHTKDKEGKVVFSEKAKKLVAERFDLYDKAEIVRKCQELRILNWGNIKAYIDDILHFPGFTGKVTIDKWCMPDVEQSVGKNTSVLPTLPD